MALQNAPTPGLIYPASANLYLLSRVQELTANVADLIQTLAGKDQQLAAAEGFLNDPEALRKRLAEIDPAYPPSLSKANGTTPYAEGGTSPA